MERNDGCPRFLRKSNCRPPPSPAVTVVHCGPPWRGNHSARPINVPAFDIIDCRDMRPSVSPKGARFDSPGRSPWVTPRQNTKSPNGARFPGFPDSADASIPGRMGTPSFALSTRFVTAEASARRNHGWPLACVACAVSCEIAAVAADARGARGEFHPEGGDGN
jgi:hypothetical protein